MRVVYETAVDAIRRHVREAAQNGQRISKIVLTDRQELCDLYDATFSPNFSPRACMSLREFAQSYGSTNFYGVRVEWPKEWGAL